MLGVLGTRGVMNLGGALLALTCSTASAGHRASDGLAGSTRVIVTERIYYLHVIRPDADKLYAIQRFELDPGVRYHIRRLGPGLEEIEPEDGVPEDPAANDDRDGAESGDDAQSDVEPADGPARVFESNGVVPHLRVRVRDS